MGDVVHLIKCIFCKDEPKPSLVNPQYRYYFRDQNGTLHCHDTMPTWRKDHQEYYWLNNEECIVSGPIIKVKFGGTTRDSEVYPNLRPGCYSLKKQFTVFPNKQRHFDLYTDKPTKSVIYGIDIETIMRIIELFSGIDDIIHTAIKSALQKPHQKKSQTTKSHLK